MRPAAFLPLLGVALLGCADVASPPPTASTGAFLTADAVKFWEAGATVSWNQLASDLAAAAPAPGINAGRLYVYLSLAQLRAAEAAQAAPGPHPPIAAAIGGASVAVLSSFFPGNIAQLEAALDAQEGSDPWPGAKHADFAAGEAIGRAVGARVLTFAQGDLSGLTDPLLPPFGPPPVGPGLWIYAPPPVIARGNLGARPFFLTSQDQLRPPPPPAFGSADFNAALAEVRQISDTRTQEQIDIANFWHLNQSPRSSAAYMGIARELIVSHHRTDADHVPYGRGGVRRGHRMLRCQVPLLVHPSPTGGHEDRDRVPDAAAPVVPVCSLLRLGGVERRTHRRLPKRACSTGGRRPRVQPVAAVRRNPLSIRHGGRTRARPQGCRARACGGLGRGRPGHQVRDASPPPSLTASRPPELLRGSCRLQAGRPSS
jgi:hypothetical protein